MNVSKQERMKKGNAFFNDVYDVVRQIPAGRATSYGAIAKYLGNNRGARIVGWAMGSSYTQDDIPAHRVVNSQGELTARALFETPTAMQEKLEKEGITVKNHKIQNWKEHFWDP